MTTSLGRYKRYKKVAMCLAIPGKVEEITNDGLIRMGKVNFGGVVKKVCLDYVPEVVVGDYTIVHVGFALSKIDEETAKQTLEDFRAMGVLDEELASEEEAFARAARRPQSNCPDGSCETTGISGTGGAGPNSANSAAKRQ
ncbi:MAG: HypC/HybG/HupF family hydrogenase formation chaperone [Terriglobales bacterium]